MERISSDLLGRLVAACPFHLRVGSVQAVCDCRSHRVREHQRERQTGLFTHRTQSLPLLGGETGWDGQDTPTHRLASEGFGDVFEVLKQIAAESLGSDDSLVPLVLDRYSCFTTRVDATIERRAVCVRRMKAKIIEGEGS